MQNNPMLLEIKIYPDPVLRKECSRIKSITNRERKFFEEMLFTMRHFQGIGLAAPQVGVSKNMIVVQARDHIIKMADPEIMDSKGMDSMPEGCLSVPDIMVNIRRPDKSIVKGLDEHGELIKVKAEGLLARVLQHEIDHLNGRIIVDAMSIFKKMKFKLKHLKGSMG